MANRFFSTLLAASSVGALLFAPVPVSHIQGTDAALPHLMPLQAHAAAARNVWSAGNSGTTQDLNGVSCPSANLCYAVGNGGTVLKTTDAGTTWEAQPNPLGGTTRLTAVACADASTCYIVGTGGAIMATTDGGASWTIENSGSGNDLHGVACLSRDLCYAVGTGGTIRVTANGTAGAGATWGPQNSGTVTDLQAISCVSTAATSGCYAVGGQDGFSGQAALVHTADGLTWTSQNSGVTVPLNAVACLDSATCFAAGNADPAFNNNKVTTVATTDGGSSWHLQDNNASNQLTLQQGGIACITATVCYAVGQYGLILATTDGGATPWQAQTSGTRAYLNGIACAPAGTCYAVGTGGVILSLASGITPQLTATVAPAATATPSPAPTNTATPVPTSTNTPALTSTATPIPASTSTPAPISTSLPPATATAPSSIATPVPAATIASYVSTPIPTYVSQPIVPSPASTDVPPPSSTARPAPSASPVPHATPTPRPVPALVLSVSAPSRGILTAGSTVTVRSTALPFSAVTIVVALTVQQVAYKTEIIYVSAGAHPRVRSASVRCTEAQHGCVAKRIRVRLERTVVLYQAVRHLRADRQGRVSGTIAFAYSPRVAVRGTLVVTVRTPRTAATRKTAVTVVPPHKPTSTRHRSSGRGHKRH